MAATALKTALILVALPLLRADQSADVRACVQTIATSLSAGNTAQAMTAFDKSYAHYDTLSDYFGGLTSAFQIVNNVDFVDQDDKEGESKLTVHWTITLTDLGSNFTQQRVGDIQVRLVVKGGKWKILEFAPIEVFNPQPQPWPKPQ